MIMIGRCDDLRDFVGQGQKRVALGTGEAPPPLFVGKKHDEQACKEQTEEDGEGDGGHGVVCRGYVLDRNSSRILGPFRPIRHLMSHQFLGAEPEVQVAPRRPALFLPEEIGTLLNVLLEGLKRLLAWS